MAKERATVVKLNSCAVGGRQETTIIFKIAVSVCKFYHVPKERRKNKTDYEHKNLLRI